MPLRYVPYHLLGEEKNIIVDGAANEHTVLTLSHWPRQNSPKNLKADLSAQIVFNYLRSQPGTLPADAMSNDHFDEDGLVGMWSLLNQEEAFEYEELLIDVAAVGDFGTYKDRDAFRIACIIRGWMDPEASPLNAGVHALPYLEKTQVLYEELLPRFQNVLDRWDVLEKFWGAPDKHLTLSEERLASGEITLEEHPEADLAIVTVPMRLNEKDVTKLTWAELIQEVAIHNRTAMMRILLVQGTRYRLYFRYETWVQYASRQLQPRVDLTNLCAQLNAKEQQSGVWDCDDNEALQPAMKLTGGSSSSITPAEFVPLVMSYLVSPNADRSPNM